MAGNPINNKRLLDTFFELLKIKSPSGNEKQIVEYVKNKLEGLGLDVHVDDSGKDYGSNSGNLVAIYKTKNPSSSKPIFLVAHLDTVEVKGEIIPSLEKGKVINKDKETILGSDDKVAVAAIIEAMEAIRDNDIPTGDIYIIFTISEEIGVVGAKYVDLGLVKARYGFVFDSDGDIGTIITRAPYQDSIYADFKGKAAHAGIEPESGINSIKAASEAVSKMKIGRLDKETTANIGKIQGGVARNIVPENTCLEMEARSLKLSKLEKLTGSMVQKLKEASKKYNTRLKLKVVREYDGFKIKNGETPLIVAQSVIKNMGITPKVTSSGGGSDINVFNAKGKRAVNLSSGMEKVHTSKEYARVRELEKLAVLVLQICKFKVK